jgi:hypothetical protein
VGYAVGEVAGPAAFAVLAMVETADDEGEIAYTEAIKCLDLLGSSGLSRARVAQRVPGRSHPRK